MTIHVVYGIVNHTRWRIVDPGLDMPPKPSLASRLRDIASAARALRAEGVVGKVEVGADGSVAFELAAHTPITQQDFREPPQQSSDPLFDASTYAGGVVPGFTFEDDDKGDAS